MIVIAVVVCLAAASWYARQVILELIQEECEQNGNAR